MITQQRLAEILKYDSETGEFIYIVNRGGMKAGDKAGSIKTGDYGKQYLRIRIDGKRYPAHRLAWLFINGQMPDGEIDHINGDSLDNRIANLRAVDRKTNGRNVKLGAANTSGVMGVTWDKLRNKWFAQIMVDKRTIGLGYHSDFQEAVKARKNAERRYDFHANHGPADG